MSSHSTLHLFPEGMTMEERNEDQSSAVRTTTGQSTGYQYKLQSDHQYKSRWSSKPQRQHTDQKLEAYRNGDER